MRNESDITPIDQLGALADRWGHRVSPETRQKIAETAGAVRREAAAWDYDADDARDDANWQDVLTVTRVLFVAHGAREAPAAPQPLTAMSSDDADMDAQTARGTRGLRKTGQAQNRRKSVAKPVASPSDASGYSRWLSKAEKQAIDAHQPRKYRERAKPGATVAQVLDWQLFVDLGSRNFWTAVPEPRRIYSRTRWFARNGVWDVLLAALSEPKSILARQLGEQRRLELVPVVGRLVREAGATGYGGQAGGDV